ncbi:MAG: hypothetical protein DME98_17015 [Verrucomicrobia bacterium]|nr:MAG: hypothetical protein DME98_17015 [Verrucomicrobiota bacterium]PYJ34702.1 MAG: hypothetical protein DME88_04185 [Verrucomicrobiota bacterium]
MNILRRVFISLIFFFSFILLAFSDFPWSRLRRGYGAPWELIYSRFNACFAKNADAVSTRKVERKNALKASLPRTQRSL